VGKILAIDFGLKRSGLAITDDQKIIASPYMGVDSVQLMSVLQQIFQKESIEKLVLGYPLRLDGSDAHITENVRMLREVLLKEFKVEVILFDERYSSTTASELLHFGGAKKSQKKDKKLVDKVAASVILSNYLLSVSNKT
jgi:putative holliday junction resolvase